MDRVTDALSDICTSLRTGRETSGNAHVTSIVHVYPTGHKLRQYSVYVHMYVCMYVHIYVHTYMHIHVCTYAYVCMYGHMHVCMYICTYICTCVHMYVYMYHRIVIQCL